MSEELRARLRALASFPAELPVFEPDAAPAEPEPLFLSWLDEAVRAGVLAPHAATLATADASGASARVLILKDLTPEGWQIATPADSRPGQAMTASGRAALTFFWPALGRQVRVEGEVRRASDAEAASDFLARPAEARATALVGRPRPTLTAPRSTQRLARLPWRTSPRTPTPCPTHGRCGASGPAPSSSGRPRTTVPTSACATGATATPGRASASGRSGGRRLPAAHRSAVPPPRPRPHLLRRLSSAPPLSAG